MDAAALSFAHQLVQPLLLVLYHRWRPVEVTGMARTAVALARRGRTRQHTVRWCGCRPRSAAAWRRRASGRCASRRPLLRRRGCSRRRSRRAPGRRGEEKELEQLTARQVARHLCSLLLLWARVVYALATFQCVCVAPPVRDATPCCRLRRCGWRCQLLGSFSLGSFSFGSFSLGSFSLGSFNLGSFSLGSFSLLPLGCGQFRSREPWRGGAARGGV